MDGYGLPRRGLNALPRVLGYAGRLARNAGAIANAGAGIGPAIGGAALMEAARSYWATAAPVRRRLNFGPHRTYGSGTAKRRAMYGGLKRRRGGSRAVVAGSMRYRPVKAVRDYPLYASVGPGRPEMKNTGWTLNALFSTTPADAVPFLVNGMQQSDALTDRTTNRIRMHSFLCRFHIRMGVDVTHSIASSVGLALVYDRQNNGVLPGFLDIFEAQNPITFTVRENRQRFQILWRNDWQLIGHPGTGIYTSATHFRGDINIPLNRDVVFSDEFATIASIRTGALFVVAMGTQANTGAGTVPLGTLELRVLFSDL